jgi:hypothetical protein
MPDLTSHLVPSASDCLLSDWTSFLRYRRPFDVLV